MITRGLPSITLTTALALTLGGGAAHAADQDGDGIADNADNCIAEANADQRDSNGDGFGNLCDADLDNNQIVNRDDFLIFRAAIGSVVGDERYLPDADFDGDRRINGADFAIMRSRFGRPPGPAGDDPGPQPNEWLTIDATGTPRELCSGNDTHSVEVDWSVAHAEGQVNVKLIMLSPTGEEQHQESTESQGNTRFVLDAPFGGPATLLASVNDGAGERSASTVIAALPPCQEPPVPDDIGFTDAPIDPPDIIGVPDADPNEVDVVHLGGSPFGPTQAKAVVAAGTGSGVKLFSYGIDQVSWEPVYLREAGPFAGRDVQLQTLYPELSPKLTVAPFVQGVRRDDGNLWLTSWQVFDDGEFKDFDTVGYGANADLQVQAYAIAHRVLDDGHYQVVTPVLTSLGTLRLVTWEIDNTDGNLWGVADSGDWGEPAADAVPSIRHLNDSLYVVSYRDQDGLLANHYWFVPDSGTPDYAYGAVSGLDHDGDNTTLEPLLGHTVNLPIASDGFITPLVTPNAGLKMDTWETRFFSWGESGVSYMPYLVSDSTRDLTPDANGVSIPQPTFTNPTDNTGALISNVRGILTDGLLEEDWGVGQGELLSATPITPWPNVHSASVTKNMTLLIAVEAVQNGEVSLDDDVTISAEAADVGGSSMGPDSNSTDDDLQEGEVHTLRNLLYGMMIESANDASAAIAEHISGAGNFDVFVNRMNLRASDLGMNGTTYNVPSEAAGAPANSVITNPQDQVSLWRFAIENSLYLQFASETSYTACGETDGGDERCYFMEKGTASYPGVEAWKGGNLGHFIPGYSDIGGPYCVGSGCLVAHATRLDRDMHVAVLHSGSRWGDANALWEYGYRLQFTPDRRGPNRIDASYTDFALDNVLESLGLVAGIDTFGNLALCSWSLSVDLGDQQKIGCHEPRFSGVAGGVDRATPTLVDGTRLSTLLADGDYWTAWMVGTQINMNLWRVGPKEP